MADPTDDSRARAFGDTQEHLVRLERALGRALMAIWWLEMAYSWQEVEGERTIVYWTGTQQPLCMEELFYRGIRRLPLPPDDGWISIVLGAAFTLPGPEGASADLVAPYGLIRHLYAVDAEGMPFVEQLTARLAGDRRVYIGYPMRLDTLNVFVGNRVDHMVPNDWPEMMRGAGFEAHGSSYRLPYWTAVGSGTQLARTQWLKGVIAGTAVVLIASKGVRTPLEERIEGWMDSDADVEQRIGECADEIEEDPSLVWRLTAGADLFYSGGGYDGNEVILNVRGVSLSEIHDVLRELAQSLGLRLYYGGEASQASEANPTYCAFDPDSYEHWMPMPTEWKRVA